MIQLLGIKKNISLKIREKLALHSKKQEKYRTELLTYFDEVVILSTCNRTEIYFNGSLNGEEGLKKIFEVFNWDINLLENCFYLTEEKAVEHLMNVVCGFHSKILGEDQILGQIKDSYQQALNSKCISSELQRLFEDAISCGKKFRTKGKLYEIPVSSASIAVNCALTKETKTFMVMGYGEVGKLVVKYILGSHIDKLYIVVRDKSKVSDISDTRLRVLDFKESKEVLNDVDCIITCTSAPHILIEEKHINKSGKNIIMFDLAVPRNIDERLALNKRVELLDIDDISLIDDENKKLRYDRMQYFKFIPKEYVQEFIQWKKLRVVSKNIKKMKDVGSTVVSERCTTFSHKCKDDGDVELAKTLIKSTADAYINKAIKLLKEEELNGRGEECLRILEKIFMSH